MSNYYMQTKHVSHKILKVRWMPVGTSNVEQPTTFLTGGCDNDENVLAMWMCPPISSVSDDQTDDEPIFLCSSSQKGDVTDLLFLDESNILTSSSNGDVNLFNYSEEFQVLNPIHKWHKLHNFSVTGLTSLPGAEMVATIGEDATINLINQPLIRPDAPPTIVTEKACQTTPNAIKLLNKSTLAIVNNAGQLKLWDVNGSRPSKTFQLLNNAVSFLSMDQHPSRSHVIVAGAGDGGLYVWDLRQERCPVAVHRGHSCDVLEVKFHKDLPNNLFTCSEDGSLWHWGSNDAALTNLFNDSALALTQDESHKEVGSKYWLLNDDLTNRRVVINDMLAGNSSPVNSLDVMGNRLVSGLDGDQLFVFSDLSLISILK